MSRVSPELVRERGRSRTPWVEIIVVVVSVAVMAFAWSGNSAQQNLRATVESNAKTLFGDVSGWR